MTLGSFSSKFVLAQPNCRGVEALADRNSEKPLAFHQPPSFNGIQTPYPEGIEDNLRFIEDDFQVAFGGKGQAAGWDYDLSSTYGQDHARATLTDTYNLSYGPTSPTSVDTGVKTFSQWTNNLDLTRAFDFGLAKPTQISWGLEQRYENYKIGKGDYASYASGPFDTGVSGNPIAPGTISGAGTTPADADQKGRTSLAAYGEIGQDLTDKWHVDLAGRYEHYNDGSGTTTNGKIATRYQLTPILAVRGSVSTGFRAPSLAQQIYSSTSQTSVNGNLFNYRNVAVDSEVAKALGATTLKPEKSTNFALGLTLQPTDATSITLDAYQIKIKDRIDQTGYLGGTPQIDAILGAAGLPTNQAVTYFTNALDTTTRGIDLIGDYRQNLGAYGNLRYTLGFNWNTTEIDDIHASPLAQATLGPDGGYNRQRQGNLKHGNPESKLILGTTWTINKFDIGLNLTRYGEYTQYGTAEIYDRTFSPAHCNQPPWDRRAANHYIIPKEAPCALKDRDQPIGKVSTVRATHFRNSSTILFVLDHHEAISRSRRPWQGAPWPCSHQVNSALSSNGSFLYYFLDLLTSFTVSFIRFPCLRIRYPNTQDHTQ